MKRLAKALIAATGLFAMPASAATLIVDSGGRLTGATGVQVDGTAYDVVFGGSTCIATFAGCDSASDFIFDSNGAMAAAQALLDQVFLGIYDTDPSLTGNCAANSTTQCLVYVPYALSTSGSQVQTWRALNDDIEALDTIARANLLITADLSSSALQTYARFTPSTPGAVPEPATWLMLILGFGLMGGIMRRGRADKLRATPA